MKIYDISQEVFSCRVYPGDSVPSKAMPHTTAGGEMYNLTEFSMCAHNGTHVDAPFHFYGDGKTVDGIALEKFVGRCFVTFAEGPIPAAEAHAILNKAAEAGADRRILIGGDATVTAEAAEVFAEAGIDLLGNESQSVGPVDAPARVHYILLKAEVVLLEGIRLCGVPEGAYTLCAAPLNLGGADGAPCRALLMC